MQVLGVVFSHYTFKISINPIFVKIKTIWMPAIRLEQIIEMSLMIDYLQGRSSAFIIINCRFMNYGCQYHVLYYQY